MHTVVLEDTCTHAQMHSVRMLLLLLTCKAMIEVLIVKPIFHKLSLTGGKIIIRYLESR